MKKLVILAAAVLFAVAGIATAAEIEGKVQSVDQSGKEMVLEDGTKIVWDEGTSVTTGKLEELKEGAKVKASYEEKDGKNVASSLEVSE
jgi:Cu/Ag efflux protein CusF